MRLGNFLKRALCVLLTAGFIWSAWGQHGGQILTWVNSDSAAMAVSGDILN